MTPAVCVGLDHRPGGQGGPQVREAAGSSVVFGARTAGSKVHVLPLAVVLKLLLPGDDGRRRRANRAARDAWIKKIYI